MEDNLINYIKVYENVLDEETLNNFLKVCETNQNFKDAAIVDNVKEKLDLKIRKTKTWSLINSINEKSLTSVHWCNYLINVFSEKIGEYFSVFKGDLNVFINDIQVLKYDVGGHYKFHVDHGSSTPRTLSLIFILNDSYEGGDLLFKTDFGSKEFKIKTKKNTLIIWPSNFLYPHCVTPVTKGVRYSVVSWAL